MWSWPTKDDRSFSFTIDGYQFPAEVEGWDANWLTLTVELRGDAGMQTRTCPCLLTWELVELSEWLRLVIPRRPSGSFFVSMELDFWIRHSWSRGGIHKLIFLLRDGLSWAPGAGRPDPVVVQTMPTTEELAETGRYLESVASTYGPRGRLGRRQTAL